MVGIAFVGFGCQATIGERVLRYPDGTIRWRVPTKNSFPHGVSETFHQNGTIESRGRYVDGEKVGTWRRFAQSGRLIEVSHWQAGELHGVIRRWNEDGSFKRRLIAVRGEIVFESYTDGESPSFADMVARFAPPEPPAPPLRIPFATLDRLAGERRVGAQLGFHRLADGASGNRLDVHGHWGFGPWIGYAQLAAGRLEGPSGDSKGKTTLELGAGWQWRLPRYGELVVRGGLALPLAGDDLEGFSAGSALGFERLTDLSTTSARSVVGRAGVSLVGSHQWAFYRADVGIDSVFSSGSLGDHFADPGNELVGRLNLGAGVASRSFSGSVETANIGRLSGSMGGERFGHTLALVGRYRRWAVQPSAGIVWPADPSVSDVLVFFVGVESEELGR